MFNLGPAKLLATVGLFVYKISRFRFQLKDKFLSTKIRTFVQSTAQKLQGLLLWINTTSPHKSLLIHISWGSVYRRCRRHFAHEANSPEVLLPFINQSGKYLKYLKSYEPIHVFTGERNHHILLTCRYFSTPEMHSFYKILSILN